MKKTILLIIFLSVSCFAKDISSMIDFKYPNFLIKSSKEKTQRDLKITKFYLNEYGIKTCKTKNKIIFLTTLGLEVYNSIDEKVYEDMCKGEQIRIEKTKE